jgi:ribosomal protein S18 acetylase RimI-like enzyme
MYTIRRAQPKDIPVLVKFRERMFQSFVDDFLDYDEMNKVTTKYLERKLDKDEFVAWVGETDEGGIIACSAISFYELPPKPWNLDGKYAYVSSMFTEPDYRGKGLGGKLLHAALDYAREMDIKMVTLHATESGELLYRFFGFQKTSEMELLLSTKNSSVA